MLKCPSSLNQQLEGVFLLKRKIATIMLMVLAMPLFSSAMPRAEAAFWDDRLVEVMAGKADILNELTALTQQLPSQNPVDVKANIIKAAETAMRDKLQEKLDAEVTNQLAKYQDKFTLLSTLLSNSSTLTPKAVQNNNSLPGEPQTYRKLLDMTATAYAPGPLDNGKWNDLTYVGGKVKKGVVAVDPTVIPMGTKLWVEGYGEAVAEDQGRAIKGNRIDLAFNTRQEALDYGIQNIKVYVLK